MPAVEVLVLAGVLSEMTERPRLDAAAREDCRRWSDVLNRLRKVQVRRVPGFVEEGAQGLDERARVPWYGVGEGIQGIGQAAQDVRGRPGRAVQRFLEVRPDQVAQVFDGGEIG